MRKLKEMMLISLNEMLYIDKMDKDVYNFITSIVDKFKHNPTCMLWVYNHLTIEYAIENSSDCLDFDIYYSTRLKKIYIDMYIEINDEEIEYKEIDANSMLISIDLFKLMKPTIIGN